MTEARADEGTHFRRREPEVVDARGGRFRPVHDHARQHRRERRAAVDRAATSTSRSRSSSGSSAGYALTFAALMLTGGKLADLFGRRLIFIVGLAIFTLSSLACGLATERRHPDRRARGSGRRRGADEPGDALDHHRDLPAARARHGDRHLGRRLRDGARDRPARRRPDHRARSTGTGSSSSTSPSGSSGSSSRASSSPESRDTSHEQRLDLPGLVTSALGLFALRYALIEGNSYGWTLRRDPRALRRRGRLARRVRPARAPPARCRCSTCRCSRTDRSPARTSSHAARRARDVRRLLLHLALHAEQSSATRRPRPARHSCR